jgi:hypothetical protein
MPITMKEKDNYPAQILLVSLLVLMIIGVIVVGVVAVASRDVLQTTSNQQYQKVYNAAESSIYQVIDKYGDASVDLSSLTTEPFSTGSCATVDINTYNCTFTEEGVTTEMEIRDNSDVEDFELTKDNSLELDLTGYRGNLVLSWTGAAAIEFGLIYEENGITKMIGDLYDASNIFTNSGNPPTQRTNPEQHPFLFDLDPSGGIRFNIANIQGLPGVAQTLSLRLTARMDETQGAINISLSGDSGFPKQIREFIATSYDIASDVQATATVITQIPLLPQAPSALNYALLTRDTVQK